MSRQLIYESFDGDDALFLAVTARIVKVAIDFKIRDAGTFEQAVLQPEPVIGIPCTGFGFMIDDPLNGEILHQLFQYIFFYRI